MFSLLHLLFRITDRPIFIPYSKKKSLELYVFFQEEEEKKGRFLDCFLCFWFPLVPPGGFQIVF